ncbi:hypothetical protein ACBZ90_17445 [Vibrio alginolyticus]
MNKFISNILGLGTIAFLSVSSVCLYSVFSKQIEGPMVCKQNVEQGFQFWINDAYKDKKEEPPLIASVHYENSLLNLKAISIGDPDIKCLGTAISSDGKFLRWSGSVEVLNTGENDGRIIGQARILE